MKNRHRTFYAMIIHGDFETRSEVELKDVGLDVYARHPSTDVWCFAWAIDDGEPEIWFPGMSAPALAFSFRFKSAKFYAHNAPFELAIWNHICVPRYGWPPLRPEQTRCTMAMAYAMALPGSLENASAALGLTQQKDMAGHRLMMQMSRPRGYDEAGKPIWWDDYDKQIQLHEYCKQDVRTEQALCERLLPLSDQEQKLWVLDQKINNAGVYVDRTAVTTAMWVVKKEVERLNGEMQKATNGEVCAATEVATMTKWIQSRGVPIEGLAKADVIDALKLDYVPEDVRKALLIRQEAGKTSTAKLHMMVTCLNEDHRARGLLQYHAAGTGRWGGRRIQVQNLPRPSIPHETIEQVMDVLTRASIDEAHAMITACFDRPMTVISDCLRGMICAAPGHELMAADFANIEGRVLAWLAGEQWKLDAFAAYDRKEGPDIYKLGYAKSFRIPVEEVTKDQRFIGKVQELACLSGDTPVLTNHGIKDVLDVTTEDRLWDGSNWVDHLGLVSKGIRETIHLAGIELTPDHLISIGQTWKPALELVSNPNCLRLALVHSSENLPSSGIMEGAAYTLPLSGEKIAALFSNISSRFLDGIRPISNWIAKKSTKDTSREIYNLLPEQRTPEIGVKLDGCSSTSSTWKPVYDLAHAGPLNRFTIVTDRGPLIVHNCGYQGGVGAFQTMAKNYRLVVSDARAEEIKNAWREAHPAIVNFWYSLENAAMDAVAHPGQTFVAGSTLGRCITYLKKGSFLFCKLPSGRVLTYPYARLKEKETPWGAMKEQIHYMKVDQKTRKWQETSLYGGLLSENVTQAVSRDILAEAMTRVDAQGYPIVMHVHDEIVVEVEESRRWDLSLFEAHVMQVPSWAAGLPIAVEGWRGRRYRK